MSALNLLTGAWCIVPEALDEIAAIYATHLRGEKIDIKALEDRLGRPLAHQQPNYSVQPGGVAVLNVSGVMAPKMNLMTQVSGGASTSLLASTFDAMARDTKARSALVVWDSPGGSVAAVPTAVDAMRNLAATKPTVSVANNVMASAAYWVGSAAGSVYASSTTDQTGSLGVISRLSWDPASPTSKTITRGKYKAASVNGEAPSAEYLAYHEAQLDYLFTLLVDGVATNRGTKPEKLLNGVADGRVFLGQQAVDAGLVDGIATVDALLAQLAANPQAFRLRGAPGGNRAPALTAPPGAATLKANSPEAIWAAVAVLPYEQKFEHVEAYANDRGLSFTDAYWLLVEDPHGPPPAHVATLPPEQQAAHARWHARAHGVPFVSACKALGLV